MSAAGPIGRFATRFAEQPRLRWGIYAALSLVFGILVLYPQPWVARAKIVPQDTSSSAASTTNLLGALGAGAQSIGSLLTGGRPSNDLYLILGRSDTVTEQVINSLKLVGPNGRYPSMRKAKLALAKKVDVRLLLGGVLEVETKVYDPDEAVRLTQAYEKAISWQLAQFGRQLIINKQRIVKNRYRDAVERVARAEAELDTFRRTNNLPDPEEQLGSALTQRATQQAEVQAKLVELETLRQSRGPENPEIQALESEIAALRRQIAETVTPAVDAAGPNLAGLSAIATKYYTLYRNVRFQQQIYDVYQKSAEQVEVEELAAESASYIQVIDRAHLDAERHFNVWAIAALCAVLLLAVFTEWYGPATGLFSRRGLRSPHATHEPA